MKTMRWRTGLLVMAAALASAGCNTMQGVGKDVQAAGKGIETAARDVGKKM